MILHVSGRRQSSIWEQLSFNDLFRLSEPKRIARSKTVRGPALDIEQYQDSMYYYFDFKSYPSTTGLRHKGYIRFLKPRGVISPNDRRSLSDIKCVVDCTCQDYRYRWAWANKQRRASKVGPQSLNQAHNRPPRITNPTGAPGLCKHLLALRDYIYGFSANWVSDRIGAVKKLDRLTKYATRRWINLPAEMAAAKERERAYAARRQIRRDQGPIAEPSTIVVADEPEPPDAPPPIEGPEEPAPPPAPTGEEPTPLPPLEGDGEDLLTGEERSIADRLRGLFSRRQEGLDRALAAEISNGAHDEVMRQSMVALREALRRGIVPAQNLMALFERIYVCTPVCKERILMKKTPLNEALKVIEQVEELERSVDVMDTGGMDVDAEEVSTAEEGGEESEALALLRDIRDGIMQIAQAEADEAALDPEIEDGEEAEAEAEALMEPGDEESEDLLPSEEGPDDLTAAASGM